MKNFIFTFLIAVALVVSGGAVYYAKKSDNYQILRLKTGDELISSLDNFANQHKGKSYWLQGIGATTNVELGFRDPALKKYIFDTFDAPYEVTSLIGNLSWDNDTPVWHIHGTFANEDYNEIGGHIKSMVVGATCELYLKEVSKLTKKEDPATGLKLLDI